MSDDAKIGVRVEGADKAQADLRAVAGAEQQVAQATGQTVAPAEKAAAAQDHAGQKAKDLSLKSRALREQLSSLGPEFGVVADLVGAFTTAMTPAALAASVLTSAVVAVSMAFRQAGQDQADQRAQAQALVAELTKQAEEYAALAEQVERVNRAESLRKPDAKPAAAAALAGELAGYGEQRGFGKAAIESAALAAASGTMLKGEQLEGLGLWYALGYGEGYGDPRQARQAFLAHWAQGNLLANLRSELEARNKRLGFGYAATQRAEAAQIAAARTPQGQSASVIQAIADRETAGGRKREAADIEKYIDDLLTEMRAGGYMSKADAWRQLQGLMQGYGGLEDVILTGRGGGYRLAGAGESGRTVAEIIKEMGFQAPTPSTPDASAGQRNAASFNRADQQRRAAAIAELEQASAGGDKETQREAGQLVGRIRAAESAGEASTAIDEAGKFLRNRPTVVNNYHGGTHTHVSGGVDPAGKALTPAGQYE